MSSNDDDVGAVLVLTTTSDDDAALALSRALVEEGLAACVTRTAVKSVFRWESIAAGGEPTDPGHRKTLCEESEVLLVIKTSRKHAADLERRLVELHPYECPELIRIEPDHVEEKYLAWLVAACD